MEQGDFLKCLPYERTQLRNVFPVQEMVRCLYGTLPDGKKLLQRFLFPWDGKTFHMFICFHALRP